MVSPQTLGGALATGSEGGSTRRSLQADVLALRLVDGLGRRRTLWRNDTAAGLRRAFRAALLGLGLAGVVTSAVLAPRPLFCVRARFNPAPVYNQFDIDEARRGTQV